MGPSSSTAAVSLSSAVRTQSSRISQRQLKTSPRGLYKVSYRYGKNLSFGRVYAVNKFGYSGLSSDLRGFCSFKFYTEDDMVNSFPVILFQVLQKTSLPLPYLTRYIQEREDVFAELAMYGSRDQIKELVLIILHLGDHVYNNSDVPVHYLTCLQNVLLLLLNMHLSMNSLSNILQSVKSLRNM